MKKLNERNDFATFGRPTGCVDGCCHFPFDIGEETCSVTFPYPCQENGDACLEIFPQSCCSGKCEIEDTEVGPVCAPDVVPRAWVIDKCEAALDLSCIGISPEFLKGIFRG